MHDRPLAGIILAAGKGTRMKSDLPKGLHRICGVPMVEMIGRAMKAAGVESPVLVIGHGGESIQQALGDGYRYAWQHEQLGTGHAALMAKEVLQSHEGPVLVAPGDAPLLDACTLRALLDAHVASGAAATMAVALMANPYGYGRILRNEEGMACRVVEEKDASPEQKSINEVCTSIYCFDSKTLFEILPNLGNANAQGEYYLTDVPEHVANQGGKVATFLVEDHAVLTGINDRWQLAQAESELQKRIIRKHALNGVTFVNYETTTVGPDVQLEPDTVIEPGVVLRGSTQIGASCVIGPNTLIEDSVVGAETKIYMSRVSEAHVGQDVRIGPFANIRPGARIGAKVKIGNFVEIKNAQLGSASSVSHLTYIGDATVGAKTNVGAGTITCNYDGYSKHRTEIGDNVFVGSNSTLVAPITIGDGAIIAAGSVVTQSVPADAGAFGRARQETKEEWAAHWRRRRSSKGQ